MTTDDRIARTLRDAADPALAPGAAERVAAGAWERAALIRTGRAPRFRVLSRIAVPAAAAAVLAGVVFALRGTDAAFAVDGDPVMVRRGDEWISSRDVPLETLVRVPSGSRVLVSGAGDVVRPRPGSVFRCFARTDGFRVEFDAGGADVSGAGVVLSLRDEVLMAPDPRAATARFSFAFDDAGQAPRFEVESGRADVRVVRSGERLVLGAAQRAALLPAGTSGGGRRLAFLEAWTSDAPSRLARGGFSFVDAGFDGKGGGLRLVGELTARGCVAFDVPPGAVRDAVSFVNLLPRIRVSVEARAATPPTRYVYEKDARRVEVDVDPRGVVVTDGADVRRYPSVAALRREAPTVAALFGDELE